MAPSVYTLTSEQKKRLFEFVSEEGWEFQKRPYTDWVAQSGQVMILLYTSGKCVIQGKGTQEFLEITFGPKILEVASLEPVFDPTWRIGMDEAGKGDFFGPLVIAGVSAGAERIEALLQLGVRDSKSLSDVQVHKIAKGIKGVCRYSILSLDPPRYNALYAKFQNLNRMLAWAHAEVIQTLAKEDPQVLLARVDQFASPHVLEHALQRHQLNLRLEQQVRGEADPVIAAASILARSAFLQGLAACGKAIDYPLPKGAGAPVLQAAQKLALIKSPAQFANFAKIHFKTMQQLSFPEAESS